MPHACVCWCGKALSMQHATVMCFSNYACSMCVCLCCEQGRKHMHVASTGGTVGIRAEQEKETVIVNASRPAARAMIALGAFIMWFTWYGFNIGSLGGISGRSGVAAHAMIITTLSAMSGAVTSVICAKFTSCFSFTISTTCNGAPTHSYLPLF